MGNWLIVIIFKWHYNRMFIWLNQTHQVLSIDYWVLGIEYCVLSIEYCVLGIKYWVLIIGYWKLERKIVFWLLSIDLSMHLEVKSSCCIQDNNHTFWRRQPSHKHLHCNSHHMDPSLKSIKQHDSSSINNTIAVQ